MIVLLLCLSMCEVNSKVQPSRSECKTASQCVFIPPAAIVVLVRVQRSWQITHMWERTSCCDTPSTHTHLFIKTHAGKKFISSFLSPSSDCNSEGVAVLPLYFPCEIKGFINRTTGLYYRMNAFCTRTLLNSHAAILFCCFTNKEKSSHIFT